MGAQAQTEERPLTRKQEAIARALADSGIKTMTQAAKVAGISRMHAYDALRNPSVVARKLELEEQKLRRSRGYRALGDQLIRSGVDKSDDLHPIEKISAGAGLVKLGHEVDDSPLGGTPADVAAYATTLRKAALLGARAALAGRLDRALTLLGAPQDVVVAALERVQMRQRNRTIQAEVQCIDAVAIETES